MHRNKTVLSSGLLFSKRKADLAYFIVTNIIIAPHITEWQNVSNSREKKVRGFRNPWEKN